MCCSDEVVGFVPERLPECVAYSLRILLVPTDTLGALGQKHAINIEEKDRPISQELVEFSLGSGPVPAPGGALTDIRVGIWNGLFALKRCLNWPS